MKQTLTELNKKIESNTIIVENFTTPLSIMDRTSRQKINEETAHLNSTIDQADLTDMYAYRIFHLTAAEYIVFSNVHGKFSIIDHMLDH